MRLLLPFLLLLVLLNPLPDEVASDGTVTETGTFELSKPSQAPF